MRFSRHFFRSALLALLCALSGAVGLAIDARLGVVSAGAWLMPPGSGQIIASAAFSGSTRAFDAQGRLIPVPSYEKFELGGYLEYGVADWLTVLAAPAYDKIRQPPPAQSYDGLGESAIGAKIGLYRAEAAVLSLQASLRTPGPSFTESLGPLQPRRAAAIDLRAMAGCNFEIASMPGFAEVQLGYRFYVQNQPGEGRFDLTLGLRPTAQLLIMAQSFSSVSNGSGNGFLNSSWTKLLSSVVYDVAPQWSLQIGAFLTVAGKNAGREQGPIGAIWYRF